MNPARNVLFFLKSVCKKIVLHDEDGFLLDRTTILQKDRQVIRADRQTDIHHETLSPRSIFETEDPEINTVSLAERSLNNCNAEPPLCRKR
jgi:hypothetical protein